MINIKDIIILKDVEKDLNNGKDFYDQREIGVGDYFWDSLIAYIVAILPMKRNRAFCAVSHFVF